VTAELSESERKRNKVAQWTFDTRPILGRFHLWLQDVRVEWFRGKESYRFNESISFVERRMERLFIMTAAVTALGTRLFGRYGEGRGLDKSAINQVKKDADSVAAYAMSESLWFLSRSLPENHAIMVCLGEGLMPKGGETPEMGANPMLGFGRIYARPQVAKFLDAKVQKLINQESYGWEDFYQEVKQAGITVWGAAIDTLENTSRFAQGQTTGPLTVLHLFDQPLCIAHPYEGYMGNLLLPRPVVEKAAERAVLIDFFAPRTKVLEAIQAAYPGIQPRNVHVWTLSGKPRQPRIGKLWEEWRALGVHLVEDGWQLPSGQKAFTDSGTYAPTFTVKTWKDEAGESHLFLIDGYAASAEAMQAASLCHLLDLDGSFAIFSSKFELSYERERQIMRLDPDAPDFSSRLAHIFGRELSEETVRQYEKMIRNAKRAGLPTHKRVINADDFFPEKEWQVLAVAGYMLPDPYSGLPGVEQISEDTFEVTVRLSTRRGDNRTTMALRLMENIEISRLVFNPLLNRFMQGEDYRRRPVRISDSGRIRNELQTLCSEALEHFDVNGIRVHFDRIPVDVISHEKQVVLREILLWYRENHPAWFGWLELV